MRPCGVGPWLVMLMNDVDTDQNKLIVDTYPELCVDAQNCLSSKKKQARWVPIMMVGVFDHWNTALWFFNQWNNVKNLRQRIAKGCVLFQRHCAMYNLCIWIQGTERQEYISKRWESPILEISSPDDHVTVKNIRLTEKQRK